MVRSLVLGVIAAVCCAASTAQAAVDVRFSTSATNANAGSDLQLFLGETGSMFVWISTDPGQTLFGASLDILSDNASVIEATDHIVANPSNRWANTGAGTLGDLVDDGFGLALPGIAGTGMATSGEFQLFSEVQFAATDLGLTNLSFGIGAQGFGDNTGSVLPGDINFGNGSVSVASAVPEPSTFAALGLVGLAVGARRRFRKTAKAEQVS